MLLLIIFIFNLAGIFAYIKWAQTRAIVDNPNQRSSHRIPTVRGGGLLFAPTFITLILLYYSDHYLAAIALLLAAGVSFVDDLRNLPVRFRMPVHFVAVALLIFDTHGIWTPIAWLLAIVLVTGWLNAFNFMDGINGITAVYAGVFLSFLWLTAATTNSGRLVEGGMLAAVLAFAWFNFRKRAACFAGDIGSISLALILAWCFLRQWTGPESIYLIAFPAVYAVDAVMTILTRLLKKENIFEAHRSHLYQRLANEQEWDHRRVAITYGLLQAAVNALAISALREVDFTIQLFAVIGLYLTLCAAYFLILSKIAPKWSMISSP